MVSLGSSAQSAYDPWALQDRIGLADARFALDSVLMPRSGLSYMDYRSGVMASGDTAGVGGSSHMAMRVRPGSGFSVTVEMGNCVVNTSGQGAYMCALDSKKTLAITPPSSTTNRVDLVIARVYDDQNSAIASPTGDRRFVVEVWEGDPVTGTPTPPTPTPTAGWTPLARVYVWKNVPNLRAIDCIDQRGPGLVARGGMRALYERDAVIGSPAFTEDGAYPGDQRWVHGNQFPHQVYWGGNADGSLAGWRGVHNELVYTGEPAPGTWLWRRGQGTISELCRVHIPYPGTPYAIYPSARFNPIMSPRTQVELRIARDSAFGQLINYCEHNTFGAPDPGDHACAMNVAPMTDGPFTGPIDIVLNTYIRYAPTPNHGFAYQGNEPGQHVLSVIVKPATIDPQKVWH